MGVLGLRPPQPAQQEMEFIYKLLPGTSTKLFMPRKLSFSEINVRHEKMACSFSLVARAVTQLKTSALISVCLPFELLDPITGVLKCCDLEIRRQ